MDLGLKNWVILSTGENINASKSFRKYEKKLTRWQRILSRRKQGGSNGNQARLKVAKIHEKVVNARRDFHHKRSTRRIRENQAIGLEDLQGKNMGKNPHLAKSIPNAEFVALLEDKAKWDRRTMVRVGKPFLSSPLGSNCGFSETYGNGHVRMVEHSMTETSMPR